MDSIPKPSDGTEPAPTDEATASPTTRGLRWVPPHKGTLSSARNAAPAKAEVATARAKTPAPESSAAKAKIAAPFRPNTVTTH